MAPSPTGTLRQGLPGHKKKLMNNILKAERFLRAALDTTAAGLSSQEEEASALKYSLDQSITKFRDIDFTWMTIIGKIEDKDDNKTESDLYEAAATDDTNGFHRGVEAAEDLCGRLHARILRIRDEKAALIQQAQVPPQIPTQYHTSQAIGAGTGHLNPSSQTSMQQTLKLPKQTLPSFDGDILKFREFWALYDETIHKRTDISNVVKMSYLIPQLKGEAAEAVKGFQISDTNYDIVVQRLTERFSRSDDRYVSMLHSELKKFPSSGPSVKEKRKMIDACEQIFRQLEQCGQTLDPGKSLVFDLLAKFPPGMIRDLDRRYHVGIYSPLSEVRKTIDKSITEEELTSGFINDLKTAKGEKSDKSEKGDKDRNDKRETTFKAYGTRFEKPPSNCFFCGGNHFNADCKQFPTASDRIRRLREQNRCNRCLRPMKYHQQQSENRQNVCDPNPRCTHCQTEGHATAVCGKKFPGTGSQGRAGSSRKQKFGKGNSTHLVKDEDKEGQNSDSELSQSASEFAHLSRSCTKNSLFQTALVVAENQQTGRKQRVRICLDTLSNRSYITEKAAGWLRLTAEDEENLNVTVFGSKKTINVKTARVSLALHQTSGKKLKIQANTTKFISNASFLPREWPEKTKQIIKDLNELADNPFDDDRSIDILIGADYAWNIIQGRKRDLKGTSIFLIPSVFGMMLGGQLNFNEKTRSTEFACLCLTESPCQFPDELGIISAGQSQESKYPDIDQFWMLETIGIKDSIEEDDDAKVHEEFKKTVQFKNGRYHVQWPWVEHRQALLPTNEALATRRFRSLTTRLVSDKPLHDEYRKVIKYQTEQGIIEKVPEEEIQTVNPTHYLPHHPIVRPGHATTKVRIVYDASAREKKTDFSLNQCLRRGPVLLPDLCQSLLRFRACETVIISDVEKAFLQVALESRSRDVTRFFWYSDDSKPNAAKENLAVYRFCRVPFGIISSPFLLAATIAFHLENDGSEFAKRLALDVYVDNVISCIPKNESTIDYYKRSKELFATAGMNLQEFCSNSKELMTFIPDKDRVKNTDAKVLGLKWDSLNDDTLRIPKSQKWLTEKSLTKRSILQAIACIFDPLGFFQPSLFQAKVFLQKLWIQGKKWDSKLTEDLVEEWQTIRHSLDAIFDLRIPRYMGDAKPESTIIAFGDASSKGYGTVVYLRNPKSDKLFETNIIFSKSRLSPIEKIDAKTKIPKKTSLPRLELLGATVTARAAEFCREAFQLPNIQIHIFCDSECVIHWLSSTKELKQFVAKRVESIRALKHVHYHYVHTDSNPADLVSRGKSVQELIIDQKWWHGPSWLSKPETEWPQTKLPPISSEALREEKAKPPQTLVHAFAVAEMQVNSERPFGMDMSRFSKLQRLINTAWFILKFVKTKVWSKLSVETEDKFASMKPTFDTVDQSAITSDAHAAILRILVKTVQTFHYSDEKRTINAREDSKRTSLVNQLNLQLDEHQILRTCSRLAHSDIPASAKCPVLLPKNHHLTKLIVEDVHRSLNHSGPIHTLSEVRQQYWIPHGRSYVKKVLKDCRICRFYKTSPVFQLPKMPPWPKERVSRSAPFQFVGLDYFGPMKVKLNDAVQKMWASLFTCLATRAVHIEIVTDCTPAEFYNSFIRFVARRGFPQQVISDNAAHFQLIKILSDRAWKETPNDKSILSYSAQKGISWKFIVQLAPWQGGHYERLVGVIKSVLKTVTGRRLLSWSDFVTLTIETEAIVNSRPITYVDSDIDSSYQPLRPIDFLLYRPINSVPESTNDFPVSDLGDSGKKLASIWKQKERHLEKLWDVWYREYVLSLRERSNPFHRSGRSRVDRTPTEGEVVLLKEDGLPRGSWKLARVKRLIVSNDHKVRAVEIQLANGVVLRRTINFLIPLEISKPDQPNAEPGILPQDLAESKVNPPNPAIQSQPMTEANGPENSETEDAFYGFSPGEILRTREIYEMYGSDELSDSDSHI